MKTFMNEVEFKTTSVLKPIINGDTVTVGRLSSTSEPYNLFDSFPQDFTHLLVSVYILLHPLGDWVHKMIV